MIKNFFSGFNKKSILFISLASILFCMCTSAQQPEFQGDLKELFKGPSGTSHINSWLLNMNKWRIDEKKKLQYSDAEYCRPELKWISHTYVYAQVMAHDRFLYDPVSRKYTVERYLNDLKKRYGGLDAVLVWPTYPNMGIDNRNQFDLLASMPGGIKGVQKMVSDFKKHGVRVFFPIMYWDNGTRPVSNTMAVALIKEMKLIGADGLNGDTMFGVTEDFRNAYDSLNYPVALQPEVAIDSLKMVEWNTMGWGYYWKYTYVPGVSVYKWLEPRHQVYITNRWMIDKTNDLQYAFFNGIGYNAWENVWGIWNQIPDRYAEAIRRISSIYHQFPDVWSSTSWTPHIPVLQKGVFASSFPSLNKTVYPFVNRDSMDKEGKQLQLPYQKNMRYFDVWNGKELQPLKNGKFIILSFPVERNGFGAVLAIRSQAVNGLLQNFIGKMKKMALKPLYAYSAGWKPLPQKIVDIPAVKYNQTVAKEMVLIPSIKNFLYKTQGVMIEGNDLPDAVGIQYPWEQHPARTHEHTINIPSFYMDKYPVTNKQFKMFIDATHYYPADNHNFLKDWSNGNYPEGWDNKPVTWVSIEDARAYASWAGKRLPHEWEWQYAAQGNDGRIYPWGNELDSSKFPAPDTARIMSPLYDVTNFPAGASSFGIMDMVGNVWQWTDEYVDTHTRAAVLKGGGRYRAQTSDWYFPRAYETNKYGKYLLMSPSLDRSAMIGFRCVMDAKTD